jgi:hypothetical protein
LAFLLSLLILEDSLQDYCYTGIFGKYAVNKKNKNLRRSRMIFKSFQNYIKPILICLVILLVSTAPVFSGSDREDFYCGSEGIFSDALHSEAAPFLNATQSYDDSRVIRSRLVKVNFGEVAGETGGPDSFLHLNLFHDAGLFARVEKVITNRSGSTTWIGKDPNNTDSSMILTGKDGVMVGSVSIGNRNFVIRYVGGEIHEIQEMDHSKYADCEEPVSAGTYPTVDSVRNDLSSIQADPGTDLDVMVVYTGSARSAAGGTTAMQNLIDQAVAESNTGYSNSNVNITMTLVHTAEVDYSETGFNWSTCLNRLKNPSDGYMDGVHPMRDAYCADVVLMVVNNQSYCGLAYTIMANESEAFCLASRVCITGYYSFAHEIGHLQGARHDRYVDPTENSPYAYNHGHTYPTDSWRTIMAYNNACSAAGTSCTRVNHWSNPNVNYMGTPTGTPGGVGVGEDNHLCLNNTSAIVANFRDSSAGCGGSGGITLSATGYKVKGVQHADLSWNGATGTNVDIFRDNVLIATVANNGSYTDNIGQKGKGSYVYKVCETDGSACSNEVTVSF